MCTAEAIHNGGKCQKSIVATPPVPSCPRMYFRGTSPSLQYRSTAFVVRTHFVVYTYACQPVRSTNEQDILLLQQLKP